MPTFLSTKILSSVQQKPLLKAGFELVQYDAIKILPIEFEMPENIENAIFTSQNTVKIIQNSEFRIMNCFCVGKKTKALLEKNGYNVAAWAEYGKDLAEIIVEKFKEEQFIFFCGTRRRDELPSILTKNNVHFNEIHTYKTELVPKQFDKEFDGILFFSPSGVESFCLKNQLKNSTAFCIGTTTAAEAKKHTDKIVIAEEAIVESVVRQATKWGFPSGF